MRGSARVGSVMAIGLWEEAESGLVEHQGCAEGA